MSMTKPQLYNRLTDMNVQLLRHYRNNEGATPGQAFAIAVDSAFGYEMRAMVYYDMTGEEIDQADELAFGT